MAVPAVPQGMRGYVFTVTAIEPIPGSRFAGGVEYSRFLEEQYMFRLRPNAFATCESRLLPATSACFPVVSQGDRESARDEVSFRLSHKLLQQTGRRAEVASRIAERFESVYPFPVGKYTATIGAADAEAQRQLAGTWSLEILPEGRLTLARGGDSPVTGRYQRQPRYRFLTNLGSGALACPGGTIEYRWYLTAEDQLRLYSYPEDPYAGRALVLQKRPWSRAGGP
jgi:hypothetical protein